LNILLNSHLKKTKPLSQEQKEAVCIVNIVGGIEIFSQEVSLQKASPPRHVTAEFGMESLWYQCVWRHSGKNYKGVKKP
jgi:hypothetical protein